MYIDILNSGYIYNSAEWAEFKKHLDGTYSELTFTYETIDGFYRIVTGRQAGFYREILIYKTGPDQLDFENNWAHLQFRDSDSSITGMVMLMESGTDVLVPVQGNTTDGMLVNLGFNNDVTITSQPALFDLTNSSTIPLGPSEVFTGTAVDVGAFTSIGIGIFSDQSSATNGISLEFSPDGVNWDEKLLFTLTANIGISYSTGKRRKYFRVVFTNGTIAQTVFRLQTYLNPLDATLTQIRINDTVSGQEDAQLVKAVIAGHTTAGGGTYVDVKVNPSGSISVDGTVEDITTSTFQNGVETIVAGTAVSVLAANPNRKLAIIQNTGAANVRIGSSGVTATTGVRLIPGTILTFTTPYIVVNEIFSIRETAVSSIVLAQEAI